MKNRGKLQSVNNPNQSETLYRLSLQMTAYMDYQKTLADSVDNLTHKMQYEFEKIDDRLRVLEKNEFARQEKSKLIWNIMQSSPKYLFTFSLVIIAVGTVGGNLITHGIKHGFSYLVQYIGSVM